MSNNTNKQSFTEAEVQLLKKLDKQRSLAEKRFPLITSLVATFGFVSLLYGFEKLIDSISFLSDNPIILLLVGLVTLGVTGTIYKKLN